MRLTLLCIALILPLLSGEVAAQDTGDWHFAGPSRAVQEGEGVTIGRINAIAFDPTDPLTLYAGTPASGLWRTQDDGASWVLLTADLPMLGITDIVVDRVDTKTIYILTGDGEGGRSIGVVGEGGDTPSTGVMKSIDGGQHWRPTGSIFSTDRIGIELGHRLAMHPTMPRILLVATTSGLYRTTDGGDNWTKVTTVATAGHSWWGTASGAGIGAALGTVVFPVVGTALGAVIGGMAGYVMIDLLNAAVAVGNPFWDVQFHPTDPSIVYAATNTDVYRSLDAGETWTRLDGGLPSNPHSNRIRLGVSPATPDTLYVLYGSRSGFTIGLYRSDDRGTTFTKRSSTNPLPQDSNAPLPIDLTKPNILGWFRNDFGSQSSYDLAMAVSPTNVDRVHVGGIDTWSSDDGGRTWEMTSRWTADPNDPEVRNYTHADIHVLAYRYPRLGIASGESLYAATDGGLYRSKDGGETWDSIANMKSGISSLQVYSICGTPQDPGLLYFGAQDNGTWRLVLDGEAKEVEADQVRTGDGMVCQINPTASPPTSIVYASVYNGRIFRSDDWAQTFSEISPPPARREGAAQWLVPYILAPADPGTIYACFADLWRGSEPDFEWKNLTNGALGASTQCRQVVVAPSEPDTIYVAKQAELDDVHAQYQGDTRPPFLGGGGVFRSNDGGATWQSITGTLPLADAAITNMAVSPTDARRVWVTFSGRKPEVKVFGSIDGGATWTNLSAGLPNFRVNAVAAQDARTHGIYVGTDDGVYYRDDHLGTFTEFKHGLPSVVVASLLIDQAQHRIFAGTFARGIWQAAIPSSCLENCPSEPTAPRRSEQ